MPRTESRPDARSRLITAAFELFAERGFEGTTVDDIAERAGVGRTTFFRAFRAKEDVIFPDHDQILTGIEARLAAATPETSLVAISEAARLVLRHYLAEGDLARGRYALTSTVPALRHREIASIQRYQRVFRSFVLDWLGDEQGAALRADLMAAAVVTAHNHVLRRWLRGESTDPEAEFDEAMAEVLSMFTEKPAASGSTVVVLRSGLDVEALVPRLRAALRED